jgi:DNA gyrase subunit A
MVTRETDMVKHLVVADTHDYLLLFTNRGKVYRIKCYDIPQDLTRTTRGTAIANVLPIDPKESVTEIVNAKDTKEGLFLVMATSKGQVKVTEMKKFSTIRSSGLIAMKLKESEDLIGACVVDESDKVLIVTIEGMSIKFAVKDLRVASRTSGGVRGIRLNPGDNVIGLGKEFPEARLLTVTTRGFGKLTRIGNFPVQARGGKGLRAHKINDKVGKLVEAVLVPPNQHLFIITEKGIVIRISIDDDVPVLGRSTQGVHLNKLSEDDSVASVAFLSEPKEIEMDNSTTKT